MMNNKEDIDPNLMVSQGYCKRDGDDWFCSFNHGSYQTEVDLQEKEHGFLLIIKAPAFTKEDFQLDIKGKELIVQAKKQLPTMPGEVNMSHISLHRTFTLPSTIDMNAIIASGKEGLLEITLPFTHKESTDRRIEIT